MMMNLNALALVAAIGAATPYGATTRPRRSAEGRRREDKKTKQKRKAAQAARKRNRR